MTLLPKWNGTITLPAIKLPSEKVGRNYIHQMALASERIKGTIYDSQIHGFDLLKTPLSKPYEEILISKKGTSKNTTTNYLCLICKDKYDFQTLNYETNFVWENLEPLKEKLNTPQKIRENWKGKFDFNKEDPDHGKVGLRAPQIGALHAISAYFSVGEIHDPGTIVLPTGIGKTETMLSSLIYNRPEKLLVLVPSDALRNQIFSKFYSLGFLPSIDVVPSDIARPKVACIKVGIKTEKEAQKIIEKSNVIIATPNILSCSNPKAVKILCDGSTDLFIDEAHHGTANTWHIVREKFSSKRVIQFTATPFRNDGKHIGGKIIFNYKLGDAQKAQYYKPIRLTTIEEFGEEEDRDRKITETALGILKADIENGKDHLLMARVNSRERAEKLHQLYSELVPEYNPVVVYTGPGRKSINKDCLEALLIRSSKVVVCVNMLGEGFDLPNLKIAAIHDGHKSLAITLQFIGRFTRKAQNVGDAAAVINIADPQAERNIQKLYAEGADWDELLKRFSHETIEKEIRLEEVIESLKQKGNLHDQISLWNLCPSFTTQIYKTTCADWYPEKFESALPKNLEHWHSLSESKKVLVILGLQENPVKWGAHQNLQDITHKLLIAYWNESQKALFIYSNDYDGFYVKKLVETITNNCGQLLCGPVVFNILNNVQLPLVKNLGTSKIGAISFTSYFGPNVTDGLAEIEKRESELNNLACLGYEDGERVIWATTQKKGKVWSVKNGSITEWMEWCDKTWSKVTDENTDETNIIRDFLKPEKLASFYSEPVISIQWGEHLQSKFSNKVSVFFGDYESPLFLTGIEINNIGTTGPIEFYLSSENATSVYEFKIDKNLTPGYSYQLKSGQPVFFQYGSGLKRPLEEHVVTDPFIIRYRDGTYSYNNYHIPINLDPGAISKEVIEVWDWDGIPLNEESMGKERKIQTIQYKTFKEIEDNFDFIFNDDGTGEAADLVALKEGDDNTIRLCLVHCKNAKGGVPSGDIDNLYTICGQAQKSIRVKHTGLFRLSLDLQRRHEKWKSQGSVVVKIVVVFH